MFQIGIAVSLFLLCVPKPVSSQTTERGADQRCLNCHGQQHIATISREERETMVVAPESEIHERKNPAALFIDQSLLMQGFHSSVACEKCHQGT